MERERLVETAKSHLGNTDNIDSSRARLNKCWFVFPGGLYRLCLSI